MPIRQKYNFYSTEYNFDTVQLGPHNSLIMYYDNYYGGYYEESVSEELFRISAADCCNTTNVHFDRHEFKLLGPNQFCDTCLAYRFVYTGFDKENDHAVYNQWRRACADYFNGAVLMDILDAKDEPYILDSEYAYSENAGVEELQDYSHGRHLVLHDVNDVPRSLFADERDIDERDIDE